MQTESRVNVEQVVLKKSELLAGLKAAEPTLGAHSSWAEEHRRLHDESFAAIVAAGVPRLFLPKSLGGFETDPVTCALVCEQLADSDTAAAWHVMVFNAAKLMAAKWPKEMVELLWADNPDQLVSASGHTPMQGRKTAEGYIVSGTQRFVSGCDHASWLMSPMLVDGEMHTVVVPMSQCKKLDNWDTLGMRGSGSTDVLLDDIFVPNVQVAEPVFPGVPNNIHFRGQLYLCPSRIVFATYVPVVFSLARRALEQVSALVKDKTPGGAAGKVRDKNIAQAHYGKALAKYRAARLMFYDALEQTWGKAGEGHEADALDRADLYLAGTHAVQTCAEVVRHVADIAATAMIAKGSELERIGRDMETLRHHGFVNESRYASVAQVHWDAELDYPAMLR
jgi:alkylation response protein AidB-like acyl-CoA dehydrogenase